MITVGTTDLVEPTWEQEASVAVKQAELFSAVQQRSQYLLNNQTVGVLCVEHAKTRSRRHLVKISAF